MNARIEELLAGLTLDEKVVMVAGVDLWHTGAVPRLGIPALKVTDGPAGARGERWTGRGSASFPCGTALGAPPLGVSTHLNPPAFDGSVDCGLTVSGRLCGFSEGVCHGVSAGLRFVPIAVTGNRNMQLQPGKFPRCVLSTGIEIKFDRLLAQNR